MSMSRNNQQSHLRMTLFTPQPNREILKTSALTTLPTHLLQLIGSYLDDRTQSLINLAQTSKSAYQALYPLIKAALVKILKELVNEDDTVQVENLLRCHPYLQLRKDKGDPVGRAYKDIETTPYQDALADPLSEEMRAVLEEGFPGETKAEQLGYAAMQSEEFKDPRFDKIREEKRKIMELTLFAYQTWKRRYQVWQESDYARVHRQPFYDAWLRIGLIQKKWPERLRKIFSVVNMDERQTFENLPRDLPKPHLYGDTNHPWQRDSIGCCLRLMPTTAKQDLKAADFLNELKPASKGQPMLIRQGEGETATYHLYGPSISLDEDKSEWRLLPIIDDPGVIQLIRCSPDLAASGTLPYSSRFHELYKFAYSQDLALGSGIAYPFAVYNSPSGRQSGKATRCPVSGLVEEITEGRRLSNISAITTLFETRTQRLAQHRAELLRHLDSGSEVHFDRLASSRKVCF